MAQGSRSAGRATSIILPGGFSYGDYLRAGAIARFSPIMQDVAAHAQARRAVLGICNGFQIACEAGLLPGALLRNASLKFICEASAFASRTPTRCSRRATRSATCCAFPIAHGDGRYTADEETLDRLEGEGTWCSATWTRHGDADEWSNPNGSMRAIAGIVNEDGNVLGHDAASGARHGDLARIRRRPAAVRVDARPSRRLTEVPMSSNDFSRSHSSLQHRDRPTGAGSAGVTGEAGTIDPGMTRAQVVAKLGKPSTVRNYQSFDLPVLSERAATRSAA